MPDLFPLASNEYLSFYRRGDRDSGKIWWRLDNDNDAHKGFAYCGLRANFDGSLLPNFDSREVDWFVDDIRFDLIRQVKSSRSNPPFSIIMERDEFAYTLNQYH